MTRYVGMKRYCVTLYTTQFNFKHIYITKYVIDIRRMNVLSYNY